MLIDFSYSITLPVYQSFIFLLLLYPNTVTYSTPSMYLFLLFILSSLSSFSIMISLSKKEFEEGQDDMAFVTSPEVEKITIANDVITLPDYASAKSRLSVR